MLVQVGLRTEESNLLNEICFGLLWLKIKTLSSVTKIWWANGKISFFGREPDKSLWRHPVQVLRELSTRVMHMTARDGWLPVWMQCVVWCSFSAFWLGTSLRAMLSSSLFVCMCVCVLFYFMPAAC